MAVFVLELRRNWRCRRCGVGWGRELDLDAETCNDESHDIVCGVDVWFRRPKAIYLEMTPVSWWTRFKDKLRSRNVHHI